MANAHVSSRMKVLLPVLALVVFVGLSETVLRLAGVDTFFQNRFFILNRALDYPEIFDRDHDLFWRLRPDRTVSSRFFIDRTYRINSLGLNSPEVDSAAGRTRLLTIGNSCTFGWGVDYERSYPRRLEALLGNSYQVINSGVPGYTSLQGKRFYASDLRRLRPDIVTVLFAFNDHWAAASGIADKDQQPLPQPVLDLQNVLSRLHSYRLLKKLILATMEPSMDSLFDRSAPVYRVGLEDFRLNLVGLCGMIRADGAEPVLLTSPIPSLTAYFPPGHKSNLHMYHEWYNAVIREVALAESCLLIDLAAAFDSYPNLFDEPTADPIHFNERGHELAARLIAEFIRSRSE